MIFRIKHTNTQHLRRRAHVTGRNREDCIAQMEAALGEYIGLSAIRLAAKPVLQLDPSDEHLTGKLYA